MLNYRFCEDVLNLESWELCVCYLVFDDATTNGAGDNMSGSSKK